MTNQRIEKLEQFGGDPIYLEVT